MAAAHEVTKAPLQGHFQFLSIKETHHRIASNKKAERRSDCHLKKILSTRTDTNGLWLFISNLDELS